jgi:hypothetical protein
MAACVGLFATASNAADYGVGVSAKSDDAWIYAPIDLSDHMRLEPSIRQSSTKLSSSSTSGSTYTTYIDEGRTESKAIEVGLGFFWLTPVADSVQLYYGVRAAYVDNEIETFAKDTATSGSLFPNTTVTTTRQKTTLDGYRVGAALGFEYLFAKHFSIGGEASYQYLDVDGDTKSETDPATRAATKSSSSQTSSGTMTQLILRYRF